MEAIPPFFIGLFLKPSGFHALVRVISCLPPAVWRVDYRCIQQERSSLVQCVLAGPSQRTDRSHVCGKGIGILRIFQLFGCTSDLKLVLWLDTNREKQLRAEMNK
jgi:hypothetical protein